jgi:hypothetical protein
MDVILKKGYHGWSRGKQFNLALKAQMQELMLSLLKALKRRS